MPMVTAYEISGSPPPWSVTGIDKFVVQALQRAERESGALPGRFYLTVCPWGERNALGGTPAAVAAATDPRLRFVHFTGCSKPYLLALLNGADAEGRQQVLARYLPWSEHYQVDIVDGLARLSFLADTEVPDEEAQEVLRRRSLGEMLQSGELAAL